MLKWQEILKQAEYRGLTSSDVALENNISLQHASVALRRLWTWGVLRRKKDKDIDSPGQPRYYYNITNKGKNYLSWYHHQSIQKEQTRQEIVLDEINEIFIKKDIPIIEFTKKGDFKNDKNASQTKSGISSGEKTEEEILLGILNIILEEIKKGNIIIAPRGIDRMFDFLLRWEYFRSSK